MDKIPVKQDPKKVGADGCGVSCLKPRTTEESALQRKIKLTARDAVILKLDRIAACPPCYPDELHTPRHALYGIVRLRWIAMHMESTAGLIQKRLQRIEKALMQMRESDFEA